MSSEGERNDSDAAGALQAVAIEPSGRVVFIVAAMVCGIIVVRNVFSSAHTVIGWAVAAAIIAMLLGPIVGTLTRHIPHLLAILVTFLVVAVVFIGINWLFTSSLLDQAAEIRDSWPEVARDIEARDDGLGSVARDMNLFDNVSELAERINDSVGTGGDALRSAAISAPSYFVSMILTIFMLVFGPPMLTGGLNRLSPQRRARFVPLLQSSVQLTQRYIYGSIIQGIVNAVVVAIVGVWLDVPAVGLLAVVAGMAALLPYVGISLGWMPLLLLSLGTASTVQMVVAVVVAVAVQVAEWLAWRPFVNARSFRLGPAVPVVSSVLGFGIYGIGGALYGSAVAVLIVAFTDRLADSEAAERAARGGDGQADSDSDAAEQQHDSVTTSS